MPVWKSVWKSVLVWWETEYPVRCRKIAMKEAMWKKKQIQTILSATHTVTAKLLNGKRCFGLNAVLLRLWKKTYRSCFKGCIDACGPNSNGFTCAEYFLSPPLSYWYCVNSAAHLNAFMSIRVIILAAEVFFGRRAAFCQLGERGAKMMCLVQATQKCS